MANNKLNQALEFIENYINETKDALDSKYMTLRNVRSLLQHINSQDGPMSISQAYLIVKEKPKDNTLYWVSYIVQEKVDDKPWVCALSSSSSMQEALIAIKVGHKYHRILSAWIDVFDSDNNKTTIMHECYLDTMGNLKNEK